MRQRVFVYGTLLRGEVNHHLLAQAEFLGSHRTAACFSLYLLRAYPGAVRGGTRAIPGEVYGVDRAGLRRLDRLEDYPTLYDRQLLATPYGRAWIYLFRGSVRDRPLIPGGDWRSFVADPDSIRAAGVRRARDPKTLGPLLGEASRTKVVQSSDPEPARSPA
jgi:gamma-glutamylaminecyclotransferase